MAAITSNTESWNGHSFSEVETHVKDMFNNNSDFIDYNGHAYVEIGGLKWATMNIGANSVTDYGQYFQWGDTAGYVAANVGASGKPNAKPFNWADYKFSGGRTQPGTTGFTKYNSTDGNAVLDIVDDAARANWGGSWRMPTTEEFVALGNAVNTALTTDYQGSGIAGLVCTDKTDSSKVLFFPAPGSCANGSVNNVGSYGFYRSSSLRTSNVNGAYFLYFDRLSAHWGNYGSRCDGYSVRPVVG